MTIELLATAPDGWAIVSENGRTYEVRPPYTNDDWHELDRAGVSALVKDSAWIPEQPSIKFATWLQLRQEMQERRIAAATPEQLAEAKSAAAELLTFATAEQAARHLARIEQQLASIGKALHALSQAPAVQDSPELRERIQTLRNQLQANNTP
jgi:hypothetical protein